MLNRINKESAFLRRISVAILLCALLTGYQNCGQGCKSSDFASVSEANIGPGCSSNEHTENHTCVNNIRPCTVTNGTGEQQWVLGTWQACTIVSCDAHYTAKSGTCECSSGYNLQN